MRKNGTSWSKYSENFRARQVMMGPLGHTATTAGSTTVRIRLKSHVFTLLPAVVLFLFVPAGRGLADSAKPQRHDWPASYAGVTFIGGAMSSGYEQLSEAVDPYATGSQMGWHLLFGGALGASFRKINLELEYTYESDESGLFEGETHRMFAAGQAISGWFRYELSTPVDLFRIQPGISLGYLWGHTEFRSPADGSEMTLLQNDGPVVSAGLRIAWGGWIERGGTIVSLEYRYRHADTDVSELPNDGGYYFDGTSTVDYSGHMILLNIGIYRAISR
jgi:hypothetical protein